MSLEIVCVFPPLADTLSDPATAHEKQAAASIPAPPLVPPAPPLPSSFPVKDWRKSQDMDSGCGSFFETLPGYNVSDDEFSENFAVSETSSRRSSAGACGLTFGRIPVAPPPPPVQFFIPRHVYLSAPVDRRGLTLRRQHSLPPSLYSSQSSFNSDVSDMVFDPERPYGHHSIDPDFEDAACIVCYDASGLLYGVSSKRPCCHQTVCQECLKGIIRTRLNEGLIQFPCPNPECNAPIAKKDVLRHLTVEEKVRFERLKVNAEGDGNRKTCPHCCHITEHELPRRLRGYREEDVKIQCENCSIEWCFNCQAPWHQGISCKQFRRGDKQFHVWTRDRPNGIANCQKCPTCRVYIQRSTGCDHMTCNRCDTHFCYKCGGRFVELPGLGDHYDKMSLFGCKYNYLADYPAQRKAVRGSYFGAKMAMLTGYPVLFVAGAAVVVVVGAVALPIYGGYRYYKFKKNTNRLRHRRRRH